MTSSNSIFSRSFWRSKSQSLKPRRGIFNSTPVNDTLPPAISKNAVAIHVVSRAVTSPTTYTVQAGDTFTSIASKLGMTLDAIEGANPGVIPTSLKVGQILNLQPPNTTYTILPGDSFYSIAAKYGTTVEILEAANPTIIPSDLRIGSQMMIPSGNNPVVTPVPAPVPNPVVPIPTPIPTPTPASSSTYTIQKGDTFTILAERFGISVAAIQDANPDVIPTKLEVGQIINIPILINPTPVQPSPVPVQPAPTPAPVPTPTPAPVTTPSSSSTPNTYTIVAGDTLLKIAANLNITLDSLLAANPGIIPNALRIGQIINLPTSAIPLATQTSTSPMPSPSPTTSTSSVGGPYIPYSGPASSYPDPSLWAPYSSLWSYNSTLMTYSNSLSEITLIGSSILTVSTSSNIDPRIILCIIMQESGGNVRVGNTFNGVINTGLMQAFNGASFNPADPAGSILQMVRDGSEGTSNGPGLKQCYAETGNWYEAARKYNSGSVDRTQLNNPLGATANYVVDFANRLMGHRWAGM